MIRPTPLLLLSLLLTLPLIPASRADDAKPQAVAVLPDAPSVAPPGVAATMPSRPPSPEAPAIYSHSTEAGPDETFLLVGEGLTDKLTAWGPSDTAAGAVEFTPKVQFATDRYLAATIPQGRFDGVTVIWAQSDKGFSRPIVLNAPQAWWLTPDVVTQTDETEMEIEIFGTNLARRPDSDHTWVYAQAEGAADGNWLALGPIGKNRVCVKLPSELAAGNYHLWVHNGSGGKLGWSAPLKLRLKETPEDELAEWTVQDQTEEALVSTIHDAAEAGGGIVYISGEFDLKSTLKVPANIQLACGEGAGAVLRFTQADPNAYAVGGAIGWKVSPGGTGKAGDELEYEITAPADGNYVVHLRYACDMSWWQQPGVSKYTAMILDGGEPVLLDNLPNTGGYEWYLWSRTAVLPMTKGKHKLVWRNIRGGGINVDAFAFALDDAFKPSDAPLPVSGDKLIVLQAETAKGARIPGRQHVAVWLCGDGAQLSGAHIQGNAQIDTGVLIRHEKFPQWIEGARVESCKITGIEGKRSNENRGVHFAYARGATVSNNEICARAPIFFSGARQCIVRGNSLIPQTRFGGGATGAILGRTNILNQCVIAENTIMNPPGREAGTPTVERMIWVSTGHGSVSENYFANNSAAEGVRFGGLPGSDQNVGEMILLEACQRVAYHGLIEGADASSVLLPKTIPATPDAELGTVLRTALAHDANGNETPFLPPQVADDDGIGEPPITEYFVTILEGVGAGQTRRAIGRDGSRIRLDRPWDCPPQKGGRVLVCTLFHRNVIAGNTVENGMSGIQLWFSCIENIVAGNRIRHQRGGGMPMVAACTTLASGMPTMWNRGLAPCNWNTFEGNLTEDVTIGASISADASEKLHPTFTLAIGNVMRHNSLIDNRQGGMVLGGRGRRDANEPPGSAGIIAELNLVRNPNTVAYRVASGADFVVLRRNLAYFWQVSDPNARLAGVQFDVPLTFATEFNLVENRSGVEGVRIAPERHVYKEPKPEAKKPAPTPTPAPSQKATSKPAATKP